MKKELIRTIPILSILFIFYFFLVAFLTDFFRVKESSRSSSAISIFFLEHEQVLVHDKDEVVEL